MCVLLQTLRENVKNRIFGACISDYQFTDEDGVAVLVDLYIDKMDNLFELDVWKTDFSPIDAQLGGHVSTHYTKAYLHHLFRTKELLGIQLASIHNLTLYLWLVKQARLHIMAGTFRVWKDCMIKILMNIPLEILRINI